MFRRVLSDLTRPSVTVSSDPATLGRVEDVNNDSGDTNIFGQAFALETLFANDSASAAPVLAFLLKQQCSDGWFRLDLPAPDAKTQGCDDDPKSAPDVDATAFAVRALDGSDDPQAQAAEDKAVAWLEDVQAADGSFGGKPVGQTPNSNSTGLAGWVLGDLGETKPAERAATWVAAHQLGDCPSARKPDTGAVAYDDAALAGVAPKGITAKTQDQFRRASAQAVPALQWLPAGSTAKASC